MPDKPSDQQQHACPHPEAVGKRYGDPIPPERQAELQGYLDRWHAETDHGQRKGPFASVHLTGADVFWLAVHSGRGDGGEVPSLHLEGADLSGTHLEGAILREAHLEGASLVGAHLEVAYLGTAHLEGANLAEAHLEGANLIGTHLEGANLIGAHLERTVLFEAHLNRANLFASHLERTILSGAHLEGAYLVGASLEHTTLSGAHLDQADLSRANLEGTNVSGAHLEGANLRNAWMDKATLLNDAALNHASLDQLSFNGANLAVVKWESVGMIGDEVRAREAQDDHGKPKDRDTRLGEHEAAVRAHLQLAAVLRSQGMSEQADRFTYRSQRLQRSRYRLQGRYGQWLFSWLLAAMAGYGYRLERILITYLLIVGMFAAGYLGADVLSSGQAALTVPHALDALQISLNAIHGRVFFAAFHLETLQSWLATLESILGIVVEGVFVAMLIQRFFGK